MAARIHCDHIKTNGAVCGAQRLRGCNFCYWHHKARVRLRKHPGRPSQEATGIVLPLLEDANSIQIALQQITQAVLDGRLDNKRAGLILYSLQLALTNVHRLEPDPSESIDNDTVLVELDSEELSGFNDAFDDQISCLGDCATCPEQKCKQRRTPQIAPFTTLDRQLPAPLPPLPSAPPAKPSASAASRSG